MTFEKIYSLQEVAEILRVDRRTLYRWVEAGKLKARKIGKSWRVTEVEVKNLMEQGTTDSKANTKRDRNQ